MIWYSKTDIGKRRSANQDDLFADGQAVGPLPNLFLVADGMGGHNAGDYASSYVVRSITEQLEQSTETNPRRALDEAIVHANAEVYALSQQDEEKKGMGTTLVGAVIAEDQLLAVNIGDSRLYILHEGKLRQVTRDHSFVAEMVRRGEITSEEARVHPKKNIITRAVGAAKEVRADFFEEELSVGDQILLCTDGLSNMIREEEIEEILMLPITEEEKVNILIETANAAGGTDNISAILVLTTDQEI